MNWTERFCKDRFTPYFCALEYARSNPRSYILSSREEYDRVPTFILNDPEYKA